jgi:hypothetical protein
MGAPEQEALAVELKGAVIDESESAEADAGCLCARDAVFAGYGDGKGIEGRMIGGPYAWVTD